MVEGIPGLFRLPLLPVTIGKHTHSQIVSELYLIVSLLTLDLLESNYVFKKLLEIVALTCLCVLPEKCSVQHRRKLLPIAQNRTIDKPPNGKSFHFGWICFSRLSIWTKILCPVMDFSSITRMPMCSKSFCNSCSPALPSSTISAERTGRERSECKVLPPIR